MANIFMFGAVSGGHFNPAVTLAVFIKEGASKMRKNFPLMIMIIASELIGATLGVIFVYLAQTKNADDQTIFPGIALLCPAIDGKTAAE